MLNIENCIRDCKQPETYYVCYLKMIEDFSLIQFQWRRRTFKKYLNHEIVDS